MSLDEYLKKIWNTVVSAFLDNPELQEVHLVDDNLGTKIVTREDVFGKRSANN